jgi:hypothetical protein
MHGTPEQQELTAFEASERRRMPGKPKDVERVERTRINGNVGNLLHADRTVEQQYAYVARHTRFD